MVETNPTKQGSVKRFDWQLYSDCDLIYIIHIQIEWD